MFSRSWPAGRANRRKVDCGNIRTWRSGPQGTLPVTPVIVASRVSTDVNAAPLPRFINKFVTVALTFPSLRVFLNQISAPRELSFVDAPTINLVLQLANELRFSVAHAVDLRRKQFETLARAVNPILRRQY